MNSFMELIGVVVSLIQLVAGAARVDPDAEVVLWNGFE